MRLRHVLACATLAAACSDPAAPIIDAGILDGPTADGDQTDAAPAMVTVIVTSGGAPVSGVPVYFQNADGSEVASLSTASGVASAVMAPGGYATAILGGTQPSDSPLVTTFAGVKPGDTLRLALPEPQASITFDLTFPANGSLGHYRIQTTCGGAEVFVEAGSTVTVPINLFGCGATTDFLVASDNGDGGPVSAFLATGVAIADGMAVTVNGTYAPAPIRTQTYTNVDPSVSGLEVSRLLYTPRGRVWSDDTFVDVVAGTGAASLVVPEPTGVVGVAAVGRDSSLSVGSIVDAPATGDYTLSTAGQFLPRITTEASFDTSTATVTWDQETTGASPDATYAQVEISRGALKASWRWQIIAPHGGASLTLPTLPGTGSVWNPQASDGGFVYELVLGKAPGGYDAIRPTVLGASQPELAVAAGGPVVSERLRLLFRSPR